MAEMKNPYEIQRARIKQQTADTGAQENEALKRKFARMGNLNSGSFIKAQERQSANQEKNQQAALEGVDIQESVAGEQKAEAERGRQFSTKEREASQTFAAGETALARALQKEQFAQTFDENKRQFGLQIAEQIEARKQQGSQFDRGLAEQTTAREKSLAYQYDVAKQARDQFNATFDQTKYYQGEQLGMAKEAQRLEREAQIFNTNMTQGQHPEIIASRGRAYDVAEYYAKQYGRSDEFYRNHPPLSAEERSQNASTSEYGVNYGRDYSVGARSDAAAGAWNQEAGVAGGQASSQTRKKLNPGNDQKYRPRFISALNF